MTLRIAQIGSEGLRPGDSVPTAAPDPGNGALAGDVGNPVVRPSSVERPPDAQPADPQPADEWSADAQLADAQPADALLAEERQSGPIGTAGVESAGVPLAEGRRALRAERQERRRLAVLCAVLIAICLAITILIVGLARDRTPGAVAPPALMTAAVVR